MYAHLCASHEPSCTHTTSLCRQPLLRPHQPCLSTLTNVPRPPSRPCAGHTCCHLPVYACCLHRPERQPSRGSSGWRPVWARSDGVAFTPELFISAPVSPSLGTLQIWCVFPNLSFPLIWFGISLEICYPHVPFPTSPAPSVNARLVGSDPTPTPPPPRALAVR